MKSPIKLPAWLTGSRILVETPMASFLVVIGLVLVVAAVSLTSQDRLARAVDKLIDVDVRVNDLALESSHAFSAARRAEKDFLAPRNRGDRQGSAARDAGLLRSNLAKLRNDMNAIRVLDRDPEISRLTRAIGQAVAFYEAQFLDLAGRRAQALDAGGETVALANAARAVESLLENLHSRSVAGVATTRAGVRVMVRAVTGTILVGAAGVALLGLLVAFVTSRRISRTQGMLRLRNRAIESSVNAVVIMNAAGPDYPVEYVNPAFERITGYSAGDVHGRHVNLLLRDETDQAGWPDIETAFREGREGRAVLRCYRKDGGIFWNDLHMTPVRDDQGGLTHFVGVLNDVTEARNYQEQLERQANYDALTGLPNRNLLQDRLQQAVAHAQRQKHIVAVALLDLDNMKLVNDSLGHKAGDEVLRLVAGRIRSCVRTTDTVARLAGDEFVLVLSGIANEENIPKVLQRIVDAISPRPQVTETLQKVLNTVSRPIILDNRELDITCSIGVSLYPHDGTEVDVLLKNAVAGMRRAKELGRNNFQFYTAELNARLGDRLALQTLLRRALDRGEFLLHYQPKVDLHSGRVTGAEALLRWASPDRGLVPPVEFIAALEDSGLIVDVGRWIIEQAAAQHAVWRKQNGRAPRIAVNISQVQLMQKNFVAMMEEIVGQYGREACGLDIEITETLIMKDVEANIVKLKTVRDLGVGIAIDDFGTGYSSFSYLAMLPITALKIDRSFIVNIVDNPDHRTVVSTIISLAHMMKHKVIAEGIDTEEQAVLLRRLGCDELQGYLFSRPLPAEEFAAWQEGFSLTLEPAEGRA